VMEVAAGQGNVARFDSLRSGVNPRARQALAWDAARAFAWGSPAEIEAVTRRIRDAEDVVTGIASVRAAAHFRDLTAAQAIASLLTRPERPRGWRAAGYLILAQTQLAQGGLQAARGALDEALPLEPDWTREVLALGVLLPQTNTDEQELRSIRTEIEDWEPGRSTPDLTFFFGVHADAHAQLRLYLVGLLSVRLGDDDAAERYRRELQTGGRTREARMLSTTLATSIAAHLAWRRGEPQRALDLLETTRLEPPLERIAISPFFSQALDRYLRGEALLALGRDQEALRWFASLTEGPDGLFWAPAHQRQSELLARMGRTQEAQRHATAVARLMSSDARGVSPSLR
jgi:tetratricopeptide (TPR) repeat protein